LSCRHKGNRNPVISIKEECPALLAVTSHYSNVPELISCKSLYKSVSQTVSSDEWGNKVKTNLSILAEDIKIHKAILVIVVKQGILVKQAVICVHTFCLMIMSLQAMLGIHPSGHKTIS
jgi:hypothetical protein